MKLERISPGKNHLENEYALIFQQETGENKTNNEQ